MTTKRLMYAAALAEMEFEAVECREVELLARQLVQNEPWHEKHRTTDGLTYHIYEVSVDHVVSDEDLHEIVVYGRIMWQEADNE